MYNAEIILEEMIEYQKSFVEKPHAATNGMPICPFAKKARLDNDILYVIEPFCLPRMVEKVKEWSNSGYRVLTLIDPNKDMPLDEFMAFYSKFEAEMPKDLDLSDSHPEHPFTTNGLYTRRDPYPNIQVTHLKDFEELQRKLKKTRYYNTCPYS